MSYLFALPTAVIESVIWSPDDMFVEFAVKVTPSFHPLASARLGNALASEAPKAS